ncbi:hypothetical protein ACFXHA_29190 [Nocardia sp. NPDC059240]|uniref:TPR repeat region-containing protein n=1 Tax=Nocardia sp. NPDC059240 TaxID=3346786 RepID=UPI0036CFB510
MVIDLDGFATRADAAATALNSTADDLERCIDGMGWSGEGRKGAEHRASLERKQMRTLATAFEDLACACRTGQQTMAPALETLKSALNVLRGLSFEVEPDWSVTDKFNYKTAYEQAGDDQTIKDQLDQLQSTRSDEAANQTVRLQRLAAEFGADDDTCAQAIAKAVTDMQALAPVSAGFSPQRADQDLADIKAGKATPDELARFKAATHLTDQQLSDLYNGKEIDVPQGQFDYLSELMKDLDKSSVDTIGHLGDDLPEDQRKLLRGGLTDAMLLISNPQLKTRGDGTDSGATQTVYQGGMMMLPTSIQTLLKDAPARQDEKDGGSEFTGNLVEIPREGDFKTFLNMLGDGNPALAQGSDLDRGLLKQAAEIAGVSEGNIVVNSGDPHSANELVDKMLSQAGGDRLAVHDLMYGTNMDCTVTQGHYDAQSHVGDLLDHTWYGHEDGVAKVIETAGREATSADPTLNRQSGEASWALANYTSTHGNELLHLHGGDLSIGMVDPKMTKALGSTLGAYIPDMVGADKGMFGTSGFGKIEPENVKNIFAVIDSNREAARDFNRAAYASIAQMNQQFGATGGANSSLGEFAGRIDTAAQAGVKLEVEGRIQDAKLRSDEEKAIFDSVKDVIPFGAKHIPRLAGLTEKFAGDFTVSDFTELGSKMGTPGFKDWIFGSTPNIGANVDLSGNGSLVKQYYNILTGMTLTPDHPNYSQDPNIGQYFDGDGKILSFDAIKALDGEDGLNSLAHFGDQMRRAFPGLLSYESGWRTGHDQSEMHPR